VAFTSLVCVQPAVGVPIDEPSDELLIAHGRRADDDPRDTGFREGLGRIEVANATTGLDLHREAVRDRAQVLQVPRRARAGAVEVDNVQPVRSISDEPFGRLERR